MPHTAAAAPTGRTDIPAIEQSVDLSAPPRHFLERYYECRYLLDCRRPGHDYRLLFHSNGLVVVMLAPTHPLVAGRATVTAIDFQVTEHTNRLNNKVSGKGKRGAQLVTAEAPLFRVTCADGARYVIPACARGKLIQLNERLRAEPQLLVTDSGGCGFVALILPKLGTSRAQLAGTLSCAEYAARRPAAAGAVGGDTAPVNGSGSAVGQDAAEAQGKTPTVAADAGDTTSAVNGGAADPAEAPTVVTDGGATNAGETGDGGATSSGEAPAAASTHGSAAGGEDLNSGDAGGVCPSVQDGR